MSSVTFYIGTGQPAFTEAVRQGGAQVTTPLGARDPSHRVVTQQYMQLASAYTAPAVNSVCPFVVEGTERPLYHIEDGPRQPIAGGLCLFTRTWATIPKRVVAHSSYAVTLEATGKATTLSGRELQDYYLIPDEYDAPEDVERFDGTESQIPTGSTAGWYEVLDSSMENYIGNIYVRRRTLVYYGA